MLIYIAYIMIDKGGPVIVCGFVCFFLISAFTQANHDRDDSVNGRFFF